MNLPEGFVLRSDYVIEQTTGCTGFGYEYRARDLSLGIPVVIKEFFINPATRDHEFNVVPHAVLAHRFNTEKLRYLREAQSLAHYKHDAVVRVYRAFESLGTVYGVYEFIEGESAKDWLIGMREPASQVMLDKFIASLLSALEMLHADGLLHRDISPENIMVRAQDRTPVLTNFASARRQSREISAAIATPEPYAALEASSNSDAHQGPWTDIYAIAAVLHHAVAGAPPLAAPTRATSGVAEVPLLQRIPAGHYRPSFLKAIDDGLQLLPQDRPRSVAEWREALLPQMAQAMAHVARAVGTKVFVSYRRIDTAHLAGRLFDHLEDAFGRDDVFFDVDAIPPGVDFRSYIETRIRQSAVVLAVIGKRWLRQASVFQRLLNKSQGTDHVFLEIEMAIRHGVPIIPVLVDGAAMPDELLLPPPIRSLAGRNAMFVRGGGDFRGDIAKVLAIAKSLKSGKADNV